MICKECGEKIEGLTRICPHCGERALIDDELETWNFIADTADKHRREIPAEIPLNEPVPIPDERTAQIDGVRWGNEPDPERYIRAMQTGRSVRTPEDTERTRANAMEEYAFLALRTREGIDEADFRAYF